jgi:uncharacterized protein
LQEFITVNLKFYFKFAGIITCNMINRLIENQLINLIEAFPVVALLGARQVGKTTLAKEIISKLDKNSIYIDLEYPPDIDKLENPAAFFEFNKDQFIIIDEVQRMPSLFPVLRAVVDRHKTSKRFLLLGSASPDLLKRSSETLAGRVIYKELNPFNILEIQEPDKINDHLIKGGFPQPFLMNNPQLIREWFGSFIMTYVERDLPNLGLSVTPSEVRRFIQMMAYNQGNLWNASMYAKSLQMSVPTIIKMAEYIENAFLIRRLPPYFQNLNKRLIKSPKYYLKDTGLLHFLLGIDEFDKLTSHSIYGNSWEGYIIEQIISVAGNNFEYFFYRTQDGTECDLVLVKNGRPLACIEVKSGLIHSRTKSLTLAIQDLKTQNNFVIVPGKDIQFPIDDKLFVCDLITFLQNYLGSLG